MVDGSEFSGGCHCRVPSTHLQISATELYEPLGLDLR